MGIKKRITIKAKQKIKRRSNRLKLKKQGLNPDDYYAEGICLGLPKK